MHVNAWLEHIDTQKRKKKPAEVSLLEIISSNTLAYTSRHFPLHVYVYLDGEFIFLKIIITESLRIKKNDGEGEFNYDILNIL
jgi:hypothetical protein